MNVLVIVAALVVAVLAVPAASAENVAAPCQSGQVPHPGFDCTVAGVHCAFFIWVDLNPPNPTFACLD